MIKTLLVTLALFTTSAFAEDYFSKVCLPNDAGGHIVLTHDVCQISSAVESYPFHAYATEENGTLHTGCFDIPSIAGVKQQEGMRIIPVVNFIDTDNSIVTFQAEWFTLEACPVEASI